MQPPERPDRDLIRLVAADRRRADRARRDLDVLRLQRGDHIAGRDAREVEAGGIEPQPHRVAAFAEDAHVVDAADALENVDDGERRVVAQEDAIVARIARAETHPQNERAVVLGDRDAGRAHLGGESADRVVHLVLQVVGRRIDVAVEEERADDRAGAVVGRRRTDVAQAVDPVDGFFERRRDRRLRGLRVRADVSRRHGDDGRRDLRELRDRERRDRDEAGEDDEERADRREDRPVQKEVDHAGEAVGTSRRSFCAARRNSALAVVDERALGDADAGRRAMRRDLVADHVLDPLRRRSGSPRRRSAGGDIATIASPSRRRRSAVRARRTAGRRTPRETRACAWSRHSRETRPPARSRSANRAPGGGGRPAPRTARTRSRRPGATPPSPPRRTEATAASRDIAGRRPRVRLRRAGGARRT